jgi:hypothetical protein
MRCDVPIFSTMLPSLAMFVVPQIADIRHRDRNVRFVQQETFCEFWGLAGFAHNLAAPSALPEVERR